MNKIPKEGEPNVFLPEYLDRELGFLVNREGGY